MADLNSDQFNDDDGNDGEYPQYRRCINCDAKAALWITPNHGDHLCRNCAHDDNVHPYIRSQNTDWRAKFRDAEARNWEAENDED